MSDEDKDSGFGFSDKSGPAKENQYSDSQKLKWVSFKFLSVGQRVKSILTGSEGHISKMEKLLETIWIDWDNGNQSRQSRSGLGNVVLLED